MKISQAYSAYEADKRLEGYSPHTLKGYRLQCRLLIRELGDVAVEGIVFERLRAYLAKESERLKPASVGFRVKFLRSLLRWCHEEGHIPTNPAAKLREPKMGQRVPKALNEESIELLREGCQSALEHALVELLYTTGCRIGEVYLLNRKDIDWENRSIIVRGKGDKEREVFFNMKCRIWLRWYIQQRQDDEPALFVTERRPFRRTSIDQLRYIVKRVADRAGVEVNVYPHKLRHSYATHLLNNGAPLEAIQSFLGHTKISTTQIYAQLASTKRKELYQKYF